MTVVAISLYDVKRKLSSLCKSAELTPRRSAQLSQRKCLSFLPPAPASGGICSYEIVAGFGVLLPVAASSREEKPTARIEDAARRSRSDFSLGYAMTRRSRPVS